MGGNTILQKSGLYCFFFILFLTSSFDLILNVNVLSFNIRFCVILMIACGLLSLGLISVNKNIVKLFKINGGVFLLIFYLICFLFIPNSAFWLRNVSYFIWLSIFIFFIPAFNVLASSLSYKAIYRIYYLSFVWLACFGILQNILARIGLPLLITTQLSDAGKLIPRVNGLSYEPSYFCGYLLIGWTMGYRMILNKCYPSTKYWDYLFIGLITTAIFMTYSRMGILTMIIFFIQPHIYKFYKKTLQLRINFKTLKILLTVLTIMVFFIIIVSTNWDKYNYLFQGLGFGGTSAHSSSTRLNEFFDTLTVFWQSPIIGCGIGGIPYKRGELYGVTVLDNEAAKMFEGMNVFAELLASVGIIGFVLFILYLYKIYKDFVLISRHGTFLQKYFAEALFYGLLAELFILNFNQNILRTYLWIHIAVINAVFYSFKEYIYKNQLEQ